AGAGTAALARRWRIACVAAFGLVGLVNLATYYAMETKPRWDIAARLLKPAAARGDVLLFKLLGDETLVLDYYLTRGGSPEAAETDSVVAAAVHLAQGGHVWAVQAGVSVVPRSSGEFARRFAVLGTPAATLRAGESIVITRFDPQ
ncbi:MAG: hypothetical protein ACREFC_07795, partial [Stellaceae bacterium]